MQDKIVVAATGNQHKLKEFRAILADWKILSTHDVGFFEEIDEPFETFRENAYRKAKTVCKATGYPALADDSGLCVEALHGGPGVHSARYSGGDDKANRDLLLKNLQGVENRNAWFECAVCLFCPNGDVYEATGRTFGTILTEEHGDSGFGYDCLFFSKDLNKSFGEATEEEKNAVSHRGRALQGLYKWLS